MPTFSYIFLQKNGISYGFKKTNVLIFSVLVVVVGM